MSIRSAIDTLRAQGAKVNVRFDHDPRRGYFRYVVPLPEGVTDTQVGASDGWAPGVGITRGYLARQVLVAAGTPPTRFGPVIAQRREQAEALLFELAARIQAVQDV